MCSGKNCPCNSADAITSFVTAIKDLAAAKAEIARLTEDRDAARAALRRVVSERLCEDGLHVTEGGCCDKRPIRVALKRETK